MKKIVLLFLSLLFIFLNNIALIYVDIPYYVYSNVIVLYLLSLYFKPYVTFIFLGIVQYILFLIGQVDSFISYSFIEAIIVVSVIYSFKILIKNKYSAILMSGLFLTIFQKVVAIFISDIVQGRKFYWNEALLIKKIYMNLGAYIFSLIITFFIIFILERIFQEG